jgi:hypothetical protein
LTAGKNNRIARIGAVLALVMLLASATLIARPAPVSAGTTSPAGGRCDQTCLATPCLDAAGSAIGCGLQYNPLITLPNFGMPPAGNPPVFINIATTPNPTTATTATTYTPAGNVATDPVSACKAKLSAAAIANGWGNRCNPPAPSNS